MGTCLGTSNGGWTVLFFVIALDFLARILLWRAVLTVWIWLKSQHNNIVSLRQFSYSSDCIRKQLQFSENRIFGSFHFILCRPFWCFQILQQESGKRGSMSEVNHQRIKTNGIWMHVAEQGTGPLVLLLHGFPETWYAWRHQLNYLALQGYHAVAPDMRGYGDSDSPLGPDSYTAFHFVGDLIGLLDHFGEAQVFDQISLLRQPTSLVHAWASQFDFIFLWFVWCLI